MRVLDISRLGLQTAERQLERTASNVARAALAGSDVDVAAVTVSLTIAKTTHAANAAVAHTASETTGTLIDVKV